MDLNAYQLAASDTDRVSHRKETKVSIDLLVPFLGLAGETGELLSEFKKQLRDGDSHHLFRERVAEELGDLLWYVATVASKYGLTLGQVAEANLQKTRDRWGPQDTSRINFDEGYGPGESFPRQFVVDIIEVESADGRKIRTLVDGEPMGAELTDNAHDPDGYRFHDVFHLAYVAVLGWSPVVRKLLGKKRRSNPAIDTVEDGGRAGVVDEGISALVFDYARDHAWLGDVPDLDYQLLRTIKGMTARLEVKARSMGEWQKAIFLGFKVWRELLDNNGGRIVVDLDHADMGYSKLTVGVS